MYLHKFSIDSFSQIGFRGFLIIFLMRCLMKYISIARFSPSSRALRVSEFTALGHMYFVVLPCFPRRHHSQGQGLAYTIQGFRLELEAVKTTSSVALNRIPGFGPWKTPDHVAISLIVLILHRDWYRFSRRSDMRQTFFYSHPEIPFLEIGFSREQG